MSCCYANTTHSLKLFFGTLFLSNYDLPPMCVVKGVIDEAFTRYPVGSPFGSYVLQLTILYDELQKKNDTLVELSENNHMGSFSNELYRHCYYNFPTNTVKSSLMFFEKFFGDSELKGKSCDHLILRDWCLHVVQFHEANPERTKQAMKFLNDLKRYIFWKRGQLLNGESR